MTPQIAITLVALIALMIGVALNPRVNASQSWTQVNFRSIRGNRMILLMRTWIAATTAVAAVALGGVALASIGHFDHQHIVGLLGTGTLLFGAVTQNFLWPATGAASPTAAQVGNQDSVVVDLTTDGVATTFTITHNLNISAADITSGWPDIIIVPNGPTGIPATLLILVTRPVTANAVVLTFAAVAATFRVSIKRPHSIGR